MKTFKIQKQWIFLMTSILITSGLFACNSGNSVPASPPTITSFAINGTPGIITSYGSNSPTTNYNISVQLPESTDVTQLVPIFTLSANTTEILANGIPTQNGQSQLNFKTPVIYTVKGASPAEVNTYTVAVNYGILTSNISESTFYSIQNGLSTDVVVAVTGASNANGKIMSSRQAYTIGDIEIMGTPSFKEIIHGIVSDQPTQPPIGTPVALVAIGAILLFLPSVIDIVESTMFSKYYYPPLRYEIPVRP